MVSPFFRAKNGCPSHILVPTTTYSAPLAAAGNVTRDYSTDPLQCQLGERGRQVAQAVSHRRSPSGLDMERHQRLEELVQSVADELLDGQQRSRLRADMHDAQAGSAIGG